LPFEVVANQLYLFLSLEYKGNIIASSSVPIYSDLELTAYKNNTALEFNKKSKMEFAFKTMRSFSTTNFLVDFGDLEPGKCEDSPSGKLIFINIILIILI